MQNKGLINTPGENNCFLNGVIQILWHLEAFRATFVTTTDHICANVNVSTVDEDASCVFCALRVVFAEYEFGEGPSMPPDALRVALSSVNKTASRFQLQEMDDAAECYEAVLNSIHALVTSQVPDADFAVCSPPCLVHEVFGLTMVERGFNDDGLPTEFYFEKVVHYVSVTALVESYRRKSKDIDRVTAELLKQPLPDGWNEELLEDGRSVYVDHYNGATQWIHPTKKIDILSKGWHQVVCEDGTVYFENHNTKTSHWEPEFDDDVIRKIVETQLPVPEFDILLHQAASHEAPDVPPTRSNSIQSTSASIATSHSRSLRNSYNTKGRRTFCTNSPRVIAIGLIWESARPSIPELVALTEVISPVIDLNRVFSREYGRSTPRVDSCPMLLQGVICYYGLHYVAFSLDKVSCMWRMFDDTTVKEVGAEFIDLLDKMQRGHFQPAVLFYERVSQSNSMDAMARHHEGYLHYLRSKSESILLDRLQELASHRTFSGIPEDVINGNIGDPRLINATTDNMGLNYKIISGPGEQNLSDGPVLSGSSTLQHIYSLPGSVLHSRQGSAWSGHSGTGAAQHSRQPSAASHVLSASCFKDDEELAHALQKHYEDQQVAQHLTEELQTEAFVVQAGLYCGNSADEQLARDLNDCEMAHAIQARMLTYEYEIIGGKVEKSGKLFIKKRGRITREWKERNFVMIGHTISYYKHNVDTPAGIIDRLPECVIYTPQSRNEKRVLKKGVPIFPFRIKHPATVFELGALSIDERHHWIVAINDSIKTSASRVIETPKQDIVSSDEFIIKGTPKTKKDHTSVVLSTSLPGVSPISVASMTVGQTDVVTSTPEHFQTGVPASIVSSKESPPPLPRLRSESLGNSRTALRTSFKHHNSHGTIDNSSVMNSLRRTLSHSASIESTVNDIRPTDDITSQPTTACTSNSVKSSMTTDKPQIHPPCICGCTSCFQCSGCQSQNYCSRECQLAHWAIHKSLCISLRMRSTSLSTVQNTI